MTDFEKFQKYFTHYQKLFGLTGYKVYFKHESLEEDFANITIAHMDAVATVRLNSVLQGKDVAHKDIKRSARHEALHLLLGRIEGIAKRRYSTADELYEACEEAVHRLEELIL